MMLKYKQQQKVQTSISMETRGKKKHIITLANQTDKTHRHRCNLFNMAEYKEK
jgi:hypothetical protein